MTTRILAQPETARASLAGIYGTISGPLAEAERIYQAELGSRYPFVERLVEHCAEFRGKQLRPALVLLCGQASGGLRPAHPILAAVVEMIHTATLVHDDILDEAMIRRHATTINAGWGNEAAVLLGDYLFTHAFHLAASLETTLACRWIGRATKMVCEGEMMQVHNRGNLDLDETSYFDVIRGKTAELTAVSCRLGAHYSGAHEAVVSALDTYGRELGIAFQIADDVLDLWGDERTTGKTLGTDLEKQKLTLPVIRLFQVAPPSLSEAARSLLNSPHPDRRELRDLLDATDALKYSWAHARRASAAALAALRVLPDSPSREILTRMAQFVVDRPF